MRSGALLCLLALAISPGGADARRKLRQSDESGETGDSAPTAAPTPTHPMYNLPPAPPAYAYPPTPPIGYPPHIEVAGTNLVVKMLDAYPEAVCNDGTPGGYYWSKGTDPSLWLVYLQGGYWCTDRLTCHGRMSDVDQASSKYWQRSTKASGIFSRSANNSAFAAANLVYVRYCSSDAWMGNTFMWEEEFRGAPTVYAVFDDLFANMGLASGAQLLFGGCSAGARGAMVHLDNVVAMLAQQGVQARGLLDSGLWLDVEPVTNTGMGGTLLKQAEYVYGFANVSSVIPADCAAAYAGEEYKCLFGQYRMPFVQSDYFLSMSQFDDFQTNYDCNTSPLIDTQLMQNTFTVNLFATQKTELCFNNFQNAMRAELQNLPTATQTSSALFSSTCSAHCTTGGADYWSINVNGVSMASQMADWWFGHNTPKVMSTCIGYQCMATCLPEEEKFPQGFGATESIAR